MHAEFGMRALLERTVWCPGFSRSKPLKAGHQANLFDAHCPLGLKEIDTSRTTIEQRSARRHQTSWNQSNESSTLAIRYRGCERYMVPDRMRQRPEAARGCNQCPCGQRGQIERTAQERRNHNQRLPG